MTIHSLDALLFLSGTSLTPTKCRVGLRGPSAALSLLLQKSRTADHMCPWLSRVHSSHGSLCPVTWARHGASKAGRPPSLLAGPPCPEAFLLLPSWAFFQGWDEGILILSGDVYSWHARFPWAHLCKPFQGCYRASKRLWPSALIWLLNCLY